MLGEFRSRSKVDRANCFQFRISGLHPNVKRRVIIRQKYDPCVVYLKVVSKLELVGASSGGGLALGGLEIEPAAEAFNLRHRCCQHHMAGGISIFKTVKDVHESIAVSKFLPWRPCPLFFF